MKRLIPLLLLASCGSHEPADRREEAWPIRSVGTTDTTSLYILQDPENGCEYIMSWRGGITPRMTHTPTPGVFMQVCEGGFPAGWNADPKFREWFFPEQEPTNDR